ncbi:hypothetical protein PAXRUDRAFT_13188 [Paxillus rubicundulus Ve08.2h10]|uniref:Uncharacterized protein n=1 Tax=Paxillus rubicundulus Ve08.2h10 TaxID=930991 RepID=A0A0D0E539_9AGAM|nr:hypothetical protein PAXRUDRAFT_13188 [Paxillus rubicundulus Ve08.2h10]
MGAEQMLAFTHKHRLRTPRSPWRAMDFLSLSPIYFNSHQELSAKFAVYKQRPRNKNRREFEQLLDNSQANRGYAKTDSHVVHYRAYFENQRTLYRLMMGDVAPSKIGLMRPSWLDGIRVVSLVFGEWSVDNRRRDDRLKEPRLIEVGWTDAFFPTFFEQLTGSSTVHLKLKTHLTNPQANFKSPHFSEVVEDDEAGLYLRLRTLLSHDANKSAAPVVVLVHDEAMARGVLDRAGIDVQSCTSGLTDLFPLSPVGSSSKLRRHSRSPQRRTNVPLACDAPSMKREEDEVKVALGIQSADPPAVYVVDVQKLVTALMETEPGKTVAQSARVLHMQTDTRPCAGDDSLLQLRMWKSMAEGLAIDEQRKHRLSRQPDCAQVLAPPPVNSEECDPNDAVVDPNDMPPAPSTLVRRMEEDEFSEDDW